MGYELLFRARPDSSSSGKPGNGNAATSTVISHFINTVGLDTVAHGRKAFVNFTKDLLLDGTPLFLPRNDVVIEILESVDPDDQILDACRELKLNGYTLALDDFVFEERYLPLLQVVDIIKVDILSTTTRRIKGLLERLKNARIDFLAEKVETRDQFVQALDLGFSYFQGFFFCEPGHVDSPEIPTSQVAHLRMLQALQKSDLDFRDLERIVRTDLAVCHQFLTYLNSASFSFPTRITSIKHALTLLGRTGCRKVLSMAMLSSLLKDKTTELLVTSLVRANFCELLAVPLGFEGQKLDLFLVGMFSLIDVILEQPMERVVSFLPLSVAAKTALLGEPCELGAVLELAKAYERADWGRQLFVAKRGSGQVLAEYGPEAYLEALRVTRALMTP